MSEDFEAWAHARGASLARSALLLTGDVQLAEDLVQEVLTRVAQRWTRLVRRGSPDGYAHRVLHNHAIDDWRRRQRRPHEIDGALLPDRSNSVEPHEATADRRLLMRQALARLTPKQRAVLVLRFYEDLTEVETAAALGCSQSTVKTQARQALHRLRTLAPELLAELDDRPEVVGR